MRIFTERVRGVTHAALVTREPHDADDLRHARGELGGPEDLVRVGAVRRGHTSARSNVDLIWPATMSGRRGQSAQRRRLASGVTQPDAAAPRRRMACFQQRSWPRNEEVMKRTAVFMAAVSVLCLFRGTQAAADSIT